MRFLSRNILIFLFLSIALILLFMVDMTVGKVHISLHEIWNILIGNPTASQNYATIILDIRLIKAITAIAVGAALSVSGLQMQTMFRNPLAGPYVLGISSGAGLGVALFIMGTPLLGGLSGLGNSIGIAGAAWIGAAAVLAIVGTVSHRVKDIMVILILGIMLSSAISAVVQILQYLSPEGTLKAYVLWTMGSLGEVTPGQLAVLLPGIMAGLLVALLTIKPLNMLLLGEEYALTMGLNPTRSRRLIILSTTLLAGTATAYCGPIGFVGMAMPHVMRLLTNSSDHRVLIPANILGGSAVMLLCDIVSKQFTLPITAITALLGIPVVVWVVIRNNRSQS